MEDNHKYNPKNESTGNQNNTSKSNFNFANGIFLFQLIVIIIFLICTELIFDCSVLLNRVLLLIILLVIILPLIYNIALSDNNSKILNILNLLVYFVLLIILFYCRNRIYRIVIHNGHLSNLDNYELSRLFKKPSSVILLYGYDSEMVLNGLEFRYKFVEDYLLNNPSNHQIKELIKHNYNSGRFRISGIVWRGAFLVNHMPNDFEITQADYRIFPMNGQYSPIWDF